MSFDDWRSYFFTQPEQADPLISDPDADPDGDQLPNLVEYYLDGIRTKSDADHRGPKATIVDEAGDQWTLN